ncbi:MAG: hypothetical protein E4H20_04665 [Spirochaetales bacterium]|nr:MAG: hypothetical protein E4H20_04665 [Spirochaetales bacterium]
MAVPKVKAKRVTKKVKNIWDFLIPVENTLVVTVPEAIATDRKSDLRKTESGLLFAPTEAESIRATFGCVAKVLKVHANLKDTYPVGSTVLIHEHGGHPVYNDISVTKAWIISEGDIMSKVEDSYWDYYAQANT